MLVVLKRYVSTPWATVKPSDPGDGMAGVCVRWQSKAVLPAS